MISQFERYGFLGNFRIYTYRNLFPNQTPIGLDLFRKLEGYHKTSPYSFVRAPITLKIERFRIRSNRYVELLFHKIDPNIPDNVFSDRTNGSLRANRRGPKEDPAISAHVVIDLKSGYDQTRLYPSCIENIDFLPRSLIVQYLNEWMAITLSEQIVREGEKKAKTFQPRFEFVAPASQTIKEALERGGVLRGVKWVEDEFIEQTFGDQAYPVVKRSNVGMSVKNRPTGETAKKILGDLYDRIGGKSPKAIKVTIEDENERTKTVGLDPSQNNVLSNVFIPQALFNKFESAMDMCEANLRKDLIRQMKKALAE